MIVRSRGGYFGGLVMASKRKDVSAKADEQARKAEAKAAIIVNPSMTVVDIATGESESVWMWELED